MELGNEKTFFDLCDFVISSLCSSWFTANDIGRSKAMRGKMP